MSRLGLGNSLRSEETRGYGRFALADLAAKLEEIGAVGFWRLDLANATVSWSPGAFRIHDLPPADEIALDVALAFYPPHHRLLMEQAVARVARDGSDYDLELDFISARGAHKRVRAYGKSQLVDGAVAAVTGLIQDVTEHYNAAETLRSLTMRDDATGLPNARHIAQLHEDLGLANTRAPQCESFALAVIQLHDLDLLRIESGTEMQDAVLYETAARLREINRMGHFVARTGIDDFTMLIRNPKDEHEMRELAGKVFAQLTRPISQAGGVATVRLSLGVLFNPGTPIAFEAALAQAQEAARLSLQSGYPECVTAHPEERRHAASQ